MGPTKNIEALWTPRTWEMIAFPGFTLLATGMEFIVNLLAVGP